MTAPLDQILDDLARLVAHDTQNPPRALTADAPLFDDLRRRLPGFECAVTDFGDGCLAFLAKRGAPRTLFNVHLDTVPVAPGWTHDPFTLHRGDERATGLGACDIKGAAACLFAAAEATDAPTAFLFTTDEEAGDSAAVRGYLATDPDFDRVIVCEPTGARAIGGHRGIYSAEAVFTGQSGHASKPGRSAVHEAARWIAAALEASETADMRLNFGRIEGGLKPNMIAGECRVRFGMRARAGTAPEPVVEQLHALAGDALASLETRFKGPALPETKEALGRQDALLADLARLGIETAEPVDFWTEASLFAAAGLPAVVLGPGDIAQAHTADEWVAYANLAAACEAFVRIMTDA
ncbi:MAG: acetylornithine deacetylase [Pseudomonadota bacterium]